MNPKSTQSQVIKGLNYICKSSDIQCDVTTRVKMIIFRGPDHTQEEGIIQGMQQ